MSTYKGIDVLEIKIDRPGAADETFDRRLTILDPGTGVVTVDEDSATPSPSRTVTIVTFTRAAAKAVYDFLDARKGRVVPFWMPSYQRDLVLTEDIAISGDVATVEWTGYSTGVYPQSLARRHLAFYEPHLAMEYHEVTDADETGTATETLELSPAVSRAAPAATTLISFLKLVRMDEDEAEISWLSTGVAEFTFRIHEVPNEVPA